MAFDQNTRNRLQRFVADARSLLADEFTRQLQATYGMNPKTGEVADIATLSGLTPSQQETAHLLRATLEHYLANGEKGKEKARKAAAIERIVREQAFTVLNRLAALRMSEARGFLTESLAKGYESKGFLWFHRISGASLGETGDAYRHYLYSLFDEFSLDLSVLFDRFSAQGRLFPSTPILLKLLALINDDGIAPLWAEDETIGWIYQFWNGRDEIDKMRSASRAPRNSREMAVRNQFFTPRYVVEFLTDNTLGRIWFEMTQGNTALKTSCKYLVRRPNEFFLALNQIPPEQEENLNLSQEELLQQTVYIEYRPLKDPRDIRMLDPACGSMHFGLYAFDLYEAIYSEAWDIEITQGIDFVSREHGRTPITSEYKDKAEFLRDVPRLIIENNIHGVDIDPRAAQIAGLSLWLRAHNSWQQAGVKPQNRSKIRRSNIVCAEPMPGEKALLEEFTATLKPTVLGQLVEILFEKMELAGEAGTLLKIEQETQEAIAEAKQEWQQQNQALSQFPDLTKVARQRGDIAFDVSDIDDEEFWEQAELKILNALAEYSQSILSNDNGQKRLFAEDTAKGFAFIELSHKRFDVLLMNPPFGEASAKSKKYINDTYFKTKGDVLANFIERAISITTANALVGAITSRTCLFLSTMSGLREDVLGVDAEISLCADLGDGVLDAMVETAAYIMSKKCSSSQFFRLVIEKEKEKKLENLCQQGYVTDKSFVINPKEFRKLNGSPYCYWVEQSVLDKISLPSIDIEAAEIKVGLQTGDDFRHLRNFWEIPVNAINIDWFYFSKTENAIAWHSPINLVVNWKDNGYELKNFENEERSKLRSRPQNLESYFKPGFSYMLRSSRLVPYIVPKGCIPTAGRSQVFPQEGKEIDVLAICASNMGSAIARFRGEMFARPKFQAGMIQQLPYVELEHEVRESITMRMMDSISVAKEYYSGDETTLDYIGSPAIEIKFEPHTDFTSLLGIENEKLIATAYGLSDLEFSEIQLDLLEAVSLRKVYEDASEDELKEAATLRFFSYLIGCAFGRWKLEKKKMEMPELSDIYQELPLQSPAFKWEQRDGYIEKNGIADLESQFGSLLIYFKNQFQFFDGDIETTQTILGINDLGEFLSKSSGFFGFHYTQYSQNRRYSPIYWLIQTPSSSCSIWLYYHRLNEQTLYTCVNDIVEPKLDNINKKLLLLNKSLRSKEEEKEFGQLTDLKLELKEFRDELLRIAEFWKPNLNDGVQITASPLWRLFQHKPWQKKLKETWEQLEGGEYDWAHLAYSIWPTRVLQKCHKDRSLAIAHEVEDDLWHEVEVIKPRKKLPVWEWQPKPLSDAELNAYIQNKIKALETVA